MYKARLFSLALTLIALPLGAEDTTPLRDPTRAPGMAASTEDEAPSRTSGARGLRLNAIVIGDEHRSARLGENLVSENERLLGATVVRIEADHVLLRDGNGDFRITWPQSAIATRSEETPDS